MIGLARKMLAVATMSVLVAPGVAGAQPDPAANATETEPTTGFERSAGERWTTASEETQFLREMDQRYAEVSVNQIGTTAEQRPIRLASIGSPTGNTVLFLCSQHGDEPSGREACLSRMRDLAATDDPKVRDMLADTRLLFVPNANPDGQVADTRENAEGIDINRDHLALDSAEARAIARVMQQHEPNVVHDLHEYGATPPYYDRDLLALWPRNLNIDAEVSEQARDLSEAYVRPGAEEAGFNTGIYGLWTDPETGEPVKQVAGDGQERILRNTVGVKHALGLLVEARQEPLTEQEKADPAVNNWRRVDSQQTGLSATLRMSHTQGDEIDRATTRARLAGLRDAGPVYFGGADNEEPGPGEVDSDPPRGYQLSSEQYRQVAEVLDAHGVYSVATEDGGQYVPMRQQARALIPLLLDQRAEHGLLS